jgi:hypothetical protein
MENSKDPFKLLDFLRKKLYRAKIEQVLEKVEKQESFFSTADHLRISQNLGEIEVLSNLYLKTPFY